MPLKKLSVRFQIPLVKTGNYHRQINGNLCLQILQSIFLISMIILEETEWLSTQALHLQELALRHGVS